MECIEQKGMLDLLCRNISLLCGVLHSGPVGTRHAWFSVWVIGALPYSKSPQVMLVSSMELNGLQACFPRICLN